MGIFFMLYFMILFPIFSGMFAAQKNRSVVGWVLIGLCCGPFGLLVAFMPAFDAPSGHTA